MAELVGVGDEAPNFDLTSTENAVLMLRDEVPRSPVLLFFFADAKGAEEHLVKLAGAAKESAARGVKIFGISTLSMAELTTLQRDHGLPFPLLHDDRGFSRGYGCSEGSERALFLVDRAQRIAWLERAPDDVTRAVAAALKAVEKMPTSTANYPRSVINRLVDRWVN